MNPQSLGLCRTSSNIPLQSCMSCLSPTLIACQSILGQHPETCLPLARTMGPRWMLLQALGCEAASVSAIAAGIRARMPMTVPMRLLLPPLLGHWQAAVRQGPAAAARLLAILTAMLGAADAKGVAAAADPVFGFLLRALDTRQQAPDGFGVEGEVYRNVAYSTRLLYMASLSFCLDSLRQH